MGAAQLRVKPRSARRRHRVGRRALLSPLRYRFVQVVRIAAAHAASTISAPNVRRLATSTTRTGKERIMVHRTLRALAMAIVASALFATPASAQTQPAKKPNIL